MIIVMKENSTVVELGQVIKALEERGFRPRPNIAMNIVGTPYKTVHASL